MTFQHAVMYLGRVQKDIKHVQFVMKIPIRNAYEKTFITWVTAIIYSLIMLGEIKSFKFNGKRERQSKSKERSEKEILLQLEALKSFKFGKYPNNKKRKCSPKERNWTNKSISFELPYWQKFKCIIISILYKI